MADPFDTPGPAGPTESRPGSTSVTLGAPPDSEDPLILTRPGAGKHRRPPLLGDPRPLLRLAGVSKWFGGIMAVQDATLVVERGESVGLVGPNGAGKTTLFNCIGGQLRPEGGSVEFEGIRLDRLPPFRRARMGIGRTYQRIEVFPDMSVVEHLIVAERSRRGDGRLWKDLLNLSAPQPDELAKVAEVLELVGIVAMADTPVSALGLGSCRLVELARALVSEPTLLMADEPSSGLDVHETHELAGVLRTLQQERGMAVLLVEHDLAMVSEVVDRAIVMDLGHVVAQGTFDEVMADPEVRHAYLGTTA
jgi:branched-chain amino acid transport system ATP-binding protein